MFSLLEADLDIQEKEGKPVAEKLAKVARSRFSVKLSENKLKEKLDNHLIPENCTEIRAPVLNVETVEKGNLDRTARKNDARLLDVQKLITTATAALVNASDQLHRVTTTFADQSTRGGEQPNPSRFVEAANEMLASNGDVIALLGTAQQELSIRRRYQLQRALPKDTASLCSNENNPITGKLFGDDADEAIKTARETFKIKNYHSGGQRPHPYKRGHNRPFFFLSFFSFLFLGQSPSQYSQSGSYSSFRGRRKPWKQRGVGKFGGGGGDH